NSAYTVSVWVQPTGTNRSGMVSWGNFSGNDTNALRMALDNSTNPNNSVVNYWFGSDLYASGPSNLYNSGWHLVTSTYNGTTRDIYIDGVLEASDTPPTQPNVAAANFTVGATFVTNSEFFNGLMDDVRIYNNALSAAQVQDIFHETSNSGDPTAPAFAGVFNTGVDASGAVLADGASDPHYTITQSADASILTPVAADKSQASTIPWTGLPDTSTSAWISPNPSGGFGLSPGNYTYETTFNLSSIDPSTATISLAGQFAADNSATVALNGNVSGSVSSGFSSYTSFSFTSGFVPG